MKVELGAGRTRTRGWVAVDANPSCLPDLVASAVDLPFADQTITRLRAVDVLEHLSYRDSDRVLAEWHRACAPDAHLFVQAPDAATIMCWFARQDDRLLAVPDDLPKTYLSGAQWRLLGGHADGTYVHADDDFRWNAHFSLWSKYSLESAISEAGFHVVHTERNGHPNLQCRAVRP